MRVRDMREGDYDEVRAVWLSCPGMGLNDRDDTREGIGRLLARNPTTCLVAEAEEGDRDAAGGPLAPGSIAGSVLCGVDGRRAYVYHTAVRPPCQGLGVGRALVEELLVRVRALGIGKVSLVVFERNGAGNAFWEHMGFGRRTDIAYRDRALVRMVRHDT